MNKKIACILLLSMLCSLAGCAKRDKEENIRASGDVIQQAGAGSGYHLSYTALPEEFVYSSVQTKLNDGIYLAGEGLDGKAIHGYIEHGQFRSFSMPENIQHIYTACIQEDYIAVLCGGAPLSVFEWVTEWGNNPEAGQSICMLKIVTYSKDGRIVSELPLKGAAVGLGAEFFSMAYLAGNFYLIAPYQFVQTDAAGNTLNYTDLYTELLSGQNSPGRFVSLNCLGEKITVCTYGNEFGNPKQSLGFNKGMSICDLDADSFILNPVIQDINFSPLGACTYTEDTFLAFDDEALYKFSRDKDKETIVKWEDLKLYSIPYTGIASTGNGYFLYGGKTDKLLELSYGEIQDNRTELVLLTNQITSTLAAIVEEFNLVNKEYYVTIETSKNPALTKVELVSGKTPDIYYILANTYLSNINEAAVFEDLYSFMDSDPVYGRNSIVQTLRENLEKDNKLYLLPFDYLIWTLRSSVKIENSEKMSMNELLDAVADIDSHTSIFQPGFSREELWYWLSNLCVEGFIDSERISCQFDSSEYTELLSACVSMPEEAQDWADQVLLKVEQVTGMLKMWAIDQGHGENYLFTGCPTGGRSSGSSFEIQQSFAISVNSDKKDGAWEFLRFTMSPGIIFLRDVSTNIYLPASKTQLESMLKSACGDGYLRYRAYDGIYTPLQISEYSAEQLIELINRTDTIMNKYPEIVEIMQEEAAKYFAGDRSAEEAAAMTQSRASIYLAEQYG